MSDKRAGARLVDRRSTRRVPSRGETHCVERVARMGTLGLRAAGIAERNGQAQKAPQATFSKQG
jgi:hypothetical protein